MVEAKKKDDMEAVQVQDKAKAALTYCTNATEYSRQINGKLWRYALIPHDQVKLNMSLAYLLKTYEIKE
ncbi:MAG: hypothetical protein Q8P34_08570 [Bacteroidota bacterium]|nr:hypothetical protein [Bacteroidota bacterium]